MDILAIGENHMDPGLEESIRAAYQKEDFDQVFLEGVSQEDAEWVKNFAAPAIRNRAEEIGETPFGTPEENIQGILQHGDFGHQERSEIVERLYSGNKIYLDDREIVVQDCVHNEISNMENLANLQGEGPDIDLSSDEGIEKLLSSISNTNPRKSYQIYRGDVEDEEIEARMIKQALQMPGSQESIQRIREYSPTRDDYLKAHIEQIHGRDYQSERENEWLRTVEENSDADKAILHAGASHLISDPSGNYTTFKDLLENSDAVDDLEVRFPDEYADSPSSIF